MYSIHCLGENMFLKNIGCLLPYSAVGFCGYLVLISGFEQSAIIYTAIVYFITKRICVNQLTISA